MTRVAPDDQAEICRRMRRAERLLPTVLEFKYGSPEIRGWGPRLRERFGYYSPGDWYEAILFDLVGPDTDWLDIGCGRNIFPINPEGARYLAQTCRFLVGVDPSENIAENTFVHERAQFTLQDFRTTRQFDLATMRMVAEHIEDPASAMAALSRLVRSGGRVVIYTVARFSLAALIAAATPMAVHHVTKRLLWGVQERDTFPVAYRMNTRAVLRTLFEGAGFHEEAFLYLDDCRVFTRWKGLTRIELALWKGVRHLGLPYWDRNLLGIYRNG